MGIRKVVVLAHEWEPYYKDEFRRSARLARELSIAIEPYFEDDDPRFSINKHDDKHFDKELYPDSNPHTLDEYDPETTTEHFDD